MGYTVRWDISALPERPSDAGQPAQSRKYLSDARAGHTALTDAIIALETRLNVVVYDAFKLDDGERALVEKATKYRYGEV